MQDAGATVTVTDSAGNIYTEIGTPAHPPTGNVNYVHQFYAKNITGFVNNIITITTSASLGGYTSGGMYEINGCDTVSPLIGNSTGSGTGASQATGSISVTGSAIFVGALEADGLSIVAGSGYTLTLVSDGSGGFTGQEYNISSVSQAVTTTSGTTGAATWGIVGAAFAAAIASTVESIPGNMGKHFTVGDGMGASSTAN